MRPKERILSSCKEVRYGYLEEKRKIDRGTDGSSRAVSGFGKEPPFDRRREYSMLLMMSHTASIRNHPLPLYSRAASPYTG